MADKGEIAHNKPLSPQQRDTTSVGPAVIHSSAKRMKPARFVPTPAGYTHVAHYKGGDLVASNFWIHKD